MRERNKGRIIIIISHQERILKIADDIVVISEGKLSEKEAGMRFYQNF